MQERIPVGLSMSKTFIAQIDSVRGDVPRSRYIQKLIEVGIAGKQQEKEKENSLAQTQMVSHPPLSAQKLVLLKERVILPVMNNLDFHQDIPSDKKVVATVTFCLTPKHSQCPGFYEDFTGKYRVNCCCQCGHTRNFPIKFINGKP